LIKLNNKKGLIEKPFWQSEWFNIDFESLGVPLLPNKLASSEFYETFYAKLFLINNSFESLPQNWLNLKAATAEAIGDEVRQNASVLSYGCGLGYVEYQLIRYRPDLFVTGVDFVDIPGGWIKRNLHNIAFTQTIENGGGTIVFT
jgi:hypothetical protein